MRNRTKFSRPGDQVSGLYVTLNMTYIWVFKSSVLLVTKIGADAPYVTFKFLGVAQKYDDKQGAKDNSLQ